MCEPLEKKGCRIHSKLLYERNVIRWALGALTQRLSQTRAHSYQRRPRPWAPPLPGTVTLPLTEAPGGNMDPGFLPPCFAAPPFALAAAATAAASSSFVARMKTGQPFRVTRGGDEEILKLEERDWFS